MNVEIVTCPVSSCLSLTKASEAVVLMFSIARNLSNVALWVGGLLDELIDLKVLFRVHNEYKGLI